MPINADLLFDTSAEKLTDLPEVGPVLEAHLVAVGIETPQQLDEAGTREAFTRIRAGRDPGACIQMLYGIEGAVRRMPAKELDDQVKSELRNWFKALD